MADADTLTEVRPYRNFGFKHDFKPLIAWLEQEGKFNSFNGPAIVDGLRRLYPFIKNKGIAFGHEALSPVMYIREINREEVERFYKFAIRVQATEFTYNVETVLMHMAYDIKDKPQLLLVDKPRETYVRLWWD